jgi:diadenosine tetraphosphate (Ap4A) HIT family hydrolase
MTCHVCEKHQTLRDLPGGPVFDNDEIFIAHFPLLLDQPAHRGHFILEFKRHLTQPSQLNEKEALELGRWTRLLSLALEKTLDAEHVYVVRIGDITAHLHFHFVPRYVGAPKNTWGPLHHNWKEGPKANSADMLKISHDMREFLQKELRAF